MSDTKIVDCNGKEILVGHKVRVRGWAHRDLATVVGLFPEDRTICHRGFWVDIEYDREIEGMMSYLLEVVDDDT